MKKQYLLPLFIMWVLVGAFASHCSKGGGYGSSDNTGNNTGSNSATVIMQYNNFSVSSLKVAKGTTVTWTNNDNTTHTVTADDNSFNSGDIKAGNSFSKTFNTPGTFPYHCVYHDMMKATVIVN
jgi:plastocyanin